MERNLYLHVGAHKTASSLIQALLKSDRNKLESEEGIKCVFSAEMKDLKFYSTIRKINDRSQVSDWVGSQEIESAHHLQSYSNLLITSEDILSSIDIRKFFHCPAEKIQFLKKIFPEHRINIILYVRRQPEYLESCYVQYIQMGRSFSFADYIADHRGSLRWGNLCNTLLYALEGGRLMVIPYEHLGKVGVPEWYRLFLSYIGVVRPEAFAAEGIKLDDRKSNRSYSEKAIAIARKINPILDKDERACLRNFLQNNFSTRTHGRATFFSSNERSRLVECYREDNMHLFQRHVSPCYANRYIKYYCEL